MLPSLTTVYANEDAAGKIGEHVATWWRPYYESFMVGVGVTSTHAYTSDASAAVSVCASTHHHAQGVLQAVHRPSSREM